MIRFVGGNKMHRKVMVAGYFWLANINCGEALINLAYITKQ
jgi:hypothetical protein